MVERSHWSSPVCSRYRANRLSAEPHGDTAISRDMDLSNTGPMALESREPTHPSLMCGRFLVAPPSIPEAEGELNRLSQHPF